MSTTASVFCIRPEAISAWLALSDALDRMADDGQTPMCQQRPDQWSSDATLAARRDAAEACTFCPVQPACLAYAIAQQEPAHVWGGRDFSGRLKRGAA